MEASVEVEDVAIVLQDTAGTIIGWTAGAARLLGYAPSEVIGRSVQMLLAPSERSRTQHPTLRAGRSAYVTKHRHLVHLACQPSVVLDAEGREQAVCNVLSRSAAAARAEPGPHRVLDASIAHSADEGGSGAATGPASIAGVAGVAFSALHTERAQFESLIDTLPGALFSFCRLSDGRCSFPHVSAGAGPLLGLSVPQLQAEAELVLSRIQGDDLAAFHESNAQSAREGSVWRCEFRYMHPEQGERWLVGTSLPTRDGNGGLCWNGLLVDITQRKRTEESLALVEAQLSSALESADMGAWVFDADTGKVWGNRHQREMWQTPADAPPWYDKACNLSQIHPEDRARAFEAMQGALAGQPMRNEFRLVRSDGTIRWIAGRGRAESDAHGRPRRVAGVNIDITQQKLLAEKTLRSQKLEALGTLAGGVAHDFNNLLFAIMGNTDVALADSSLAGHIRAMLLEVRDAALRAADLVRQILAFSRPQEQEAKVIALLGPVGDALKLVRASTPSMIGLISQLDPATPAVRADSSRIGQIVVNLCTNAAHAVGKGRAGSVRVALMPAEIGADAASQLSQVPAGKYAVLSVSDDGCGMDRATQARVFDPFFTTKPRGEGTGLGLSVVHGIVQALGGHIVVRSEPGKGTTFELYFPALDAEPERAAAEVSLPTRGQGQVIMLVDDEPMVVSLGIRLLESLGYRAVAFAHAQQALDAFRREPSAYAVVVTDHSMPSFSGFELARKMLAIRADVPIVLMSGNLEPEERSAALRAGVRETLLKPSDLGTLGEVIARLC
jgi:signal transduction histidine kinase/CheY-like chemotaxis protein